MEIMTEDMSTCDRCKSEFYFEDLIWDSDMEESDERLETLFGEESTFGIKEPTKMNNVFSKGYTALCCSCLHEESK